MLLPMSSSMKKTRYFVLFALVVSPMIAACGGDEEEDSASAPQLRGTYRPVDQGPIGSVTFSGNQDYLLIPNGCTGAACAEIGTYRMDGKARVLVLENAATHQTRSLPFEIVETAPAANTSLLKNVTPLDFVGRNQDLLGSSGGGLANGGGQQVVSGGQSDVLGGVSKVLDLVLQLIMQGQKLVRDSKEQAEDAKKDEKKDDEKKDDEKNPKNPLDCSQGVPTKDSTPAEALAYFARCPNGP